MKTLSAVLVAALAPLALAVAGTAAAVAAGHPDHRIYVAAKGCTGHAFQPRQIVIACGDGNFYAAGLHWSAYGGRTARATGRLDSNDCRPSCVAGHFHSYAGAVTLGRVASCHGRLYYDRLTWRFSGHGPFRNGSVSIRPQACSPTPG